jgi:Flp pilus assembly protein TadD
MTKKFCNKCGNALTKTGAKFCTTCGATVDGAETDDISSQETRALPGEQTDQIAPATEVIPAIKPTSYETEEMPRTVITAPAEDRATEVIEAISPTPATESPKKKAEPAQEKQPSVKSPKKKAKSAQEKQPSVQQSGGSSGGRKKLAVAAALGVVVILAVAVAAFFFVSSRKTTEAQAGTQSANNAEPSTPAQPVAQQPIQQPTQQANQQLSQQSSANNQAQSQARTQPSPSIGEVKSPAVRNDESASRPQQQVAAKPTPAVPEISAAEHKDQGITHMNSGRYQEALREYDYVRKLDPGNKDVYYLIGQTYHKMNQLEQALDAYRQCTSGNYASVSQSAVKNLEKKLGKVSAK